MYRKKRFRLVLISWMAVNIVACSTGNNPNNNLPNPPIPSPSPNPPNPAPSPGGGGGGGGGGGSSNITLSGQSGIYVAPLTSFGVARSSMKTALLAPSFDTSANTVCANCDVTVYQVSPGSAPVSVNTTTTDSSGNYSITVPPATLSADGSSGFYYQVSISNGSASVSTLVAPTENVLSVNVAPETSMALTTVSSIAIPEFGMPVEDAAAYPPALLLNATNSGTTAASVTLVNDGAIFVPPSSNESLTVAIVCVK